MGLGSVVREIKLEWASVEAKKRREDVVQADHRWRLHSHLMDFLTRTKEIDLDPEMWFGPSIVAGMCPRAYVLAHRMGVPLLREFMPDNYWHMDHGTALHEMFQSMWLGPMGVLKGGWKCSECAHVHGIDHDDKEEIFGHDGKPIVDKVTVDSAIHRPKVCEKCGMEPGWRRDFIYQEPIIYDIELKVAGWTDGIISMPVKGDEELNEDDDELIDIKSCKASALRGIRNRGPYAEHITQLNWYLDMTRHQRCRFTKGRIIYVGRGEEDFTKAIEECRVVLDPTLMDSEREKIRGIRQALKKSKPKLPSCPNGGRRPWGPCECAGLEDARARFGY